MRDRVRPPAKLERVLDQLKEEGIFATKQKGMMFAAALGFRLSRLDSPTAPERTGEGIRLEYFQKPRDDGFIDALAVTQADTLKALEATNQDERLEVFEAYAEQGLKKIDEMLQVKGQDALGAILELLDLYGFGLGRVETLPGLEGMAERVAEQL